MAVAPMAVVPTAAAPAPARWCPPGHPAARGRTVILKAHRRPSAGPGQRNGVTHPQTPSPLPQAAASAAPGTVPAELLLTDLSGFAADVVTAMTRAAAHRGDTYLNADGGDLGGGVSATLVVRHAANHLAVLQTAQHMGLDVGDLLDVGCGTGAPASTLARHLGARLHLCDHDAGPLGVAQRAFDPASATTDLAQSPAADVVTSMDVIEHIPATDQDSFIAALADKVRPGGLLALATPDESSYPGGWSGYHPHIGCLSPTELQRLLSRATGRPATVLRLSGGPFAPHGPRQVWERIANTAWGAIATRRPDLAARLAGLGGSTAPSAAAVQEGAQDPIVLLDPVRTRSTGLLGLVPF